MLPDPTEILLTYKLPLTPTPPLTTNAPVVVLVLTVPESAIILPAASIIPPVNNAPPMPAPPRTINAPVEVLVLGVVFAARILPAFTGSYSTSAEVILTIPPPGAVFKLLKNTHSLV